ncbi:MAG: hypothetical protein CR989_05155 [Flavobacteriales bacterium]|nr:MAG: hypothetical protein CR989_05155 [Flavobacteriales bacterium]
MLRVLNYNQIESSFNSCLYEKGSCRESRNILAIADALYIKHLELKEKTIAISKKLSNFIK